MNCETCNDELFVSQSPDSADVPCPDCQHCDEPGDDGPWEPVSSLVAIENA